jgi:hypothetical protein
MEKQTIKVKVRPARNAVVVAMMNRSQKAGAHKDRKKEAKRRACRDWKGGDE